MVGATITLQNSKVNTGIQDSIRESMKRMIMDSYDPRVWVLLNTIQEEVSVKLNVLIPIEIR